MSSEKNQATAALKERIAQREALQAKKSKNSIKGWPDNQTQPLAIKGLPEGPLSPYSATIFAKITGQLDI